MVWCNDMQFEVILYNPKLDPKSNVYREMTTPEGLFVIASPDDEFQIMINSENKENHFAVVTIIDGYTMPQPKTFRRSCRILGFREGPSNYRAFKFQRPPHDSLSSNQFLKPQLSDKKYLDINNCHENDRTDYSGGPGEITIKIYQTQDVPRKESSGEPRAPRTPKEHNDPVFQPFSYNDSKKSIEQSLGIAVGELYGEIGGGGGAPRLDRPPRNPDSMQHKAMIEESAIVAVFRLFYTDIYSMIEKRYLNLDFPQHLTLIPLSFLQNNDRQIIRIMQTVVRGGRAGNPNGAKLQEIAARCEHWIKYPLQQLIGSGIKVENEAPATEQDLLKEFFKRNEGFFIEDQETNMIKVGNPVSKKVNLVQAEQGEI